MAVYDFSVGVFRSEYPAFVDETKYPDTMITTAFTSAETYFHNDDASIYPYDPPHNYFRKYLLDRATCHLLYMASLPVDQVGRVVEPYKLRDAGMAYACPVPFRRPDLS